MRGSSAAKILKRFEHWEFCGESLIPIEKIDFRGARIPAFVENACCLTILLFYDGNLRSVSECLVPPDPVRQFQDKRSGNGGQA